MKKNLTIIFAALIPLAAMLMYSRGQRMPSPSSVVVERSTTIPKAENNDVVNSEALKRKAEGIRKLVELEREYVLHAKKFAQESTPESVRQGAIDSLKSKEKRYRSLLESLNIQKTDADKVLEIVLERNIQCEIINIDSGTMSDFEMREFLRSGQAIPNARARLDMTKIIGEEKVKKLDLLEQQFHDELIKKIKSSIED